ncbi:MAG TPA: hypothetical protein VHO84_09875, partial [Syntrophorhabdaceae bacterium]|nr:hypothetical protein [Syntrophorhabdaceae bacterium]
MYIVPQEMHVHTLVKDRGIQHMAAQLGGNGLPAAPLTDTARPFFPLRTIAAYSGTQCSSLCNTAGLMRLPKNRKLGDPHPWAIGRDRYIRYDGDSLWHTQ